MQIFYKTSTGNSILILPGHTSEVMQRSVLGKKNFTVMGVKEKLTMAGKNNKN